MTIWVSGATGFIGRHLVARLPHDELVLVGREASTLQPRGAKIVVADLAHPEAAASAGSAEVIYHLAGFSHVGKANDAPADAFRGNATATVNVLEAARKSASLKRFVHVSTGQVYGPARYSPIDEEHPLAPINPYGATKLAGDRLVQAYHHTYGIPTTIIRPFNIYGPGQARGFVVPDILHQVREGKRPVMGDTSIVRDFTYVDDFIALLLLAATHPRAVGEAFNAGSGRGTSIRDVARILLKLGGLGGDPIEDPALFRVGDLAELIVSPKKAHALLGWNACIPIEDGLARTFRGPATA